jgi:hypothetical protein
MQPGNTPHLIDEAKVSVAGRSAYEQNPPHLTNDDTIGRLS